MTRSLALTGTLLFVFAAPAMAASTVVTQPHQDRPQIVTDEKNNVVRILIGGRDILTIDARGLHVNGDLSYSGTLNSAPPKPNPAK